MICSAIDVAQLSIGRLSYNWSHSGHSSCDLPTEELDNTVKIARDNKQTYLFHGTQGPYITAKLLSLTVYLHDILANLTTCEFGLKFPKGGFLSIQLLAKLTKIAVSSEAGVALQRLPQRYSSLYNPLQQSESLLAATPVDEGNES